MDNFLYDDKPVSWFSSSGASAFKTSFDHHRFSESFIDSVNHRYRNFVQSSVPKRKAEFIAGRYCAHQSLAKWWVSSECIGVGKKRDPVWPNGIVGSISHCNSFALAVTAFTESHFAIGTDVEDIVSDEVRQKLQRAIIRKDEAFLLEEAHDPNVIFTLIFSLKESFFKAAYPHLGFYFDFPAVSVLEIDLDHGNIMFKANQHLGSIFQPGKVFSSQFKHLDNNRVVTFFQIERHDLVQLARESWINRTGNTLTQFKSNGK